MFHSLPLDSFLAIRSHSVLGADGKPNVNLHMCELLLCIKFSWLRRAWQDLSASTVARDYSCPFSRCCARGVCVLLFKSLSSTQLYLQCDSLSTRTVLQA